jgi:hypothetical protein
MGVSGHLHARAALLRRKSLRYALSRRLGGPQSRSGRCGKETNLSRNRSSAVQPVARRYTGSAILGLVSKDLHIINISSSGSGGKVSYTFSVMSKMPAEINVCTGVICYEDVDRIRMAQHRAFINTAIIHRTEVFDQVSNH